MSNDAAPKLSSVERVANIPVVNDSLHQAHQIILSNGLTARAYGLAENVVKTSWGYAVPVLGYGKPYIESADGLANKGLDMVESRFPYPFKTDTNQVLADAKKPVDQMSGVARGIYDNRIAPLQGQPIVQKAVDSIHVINQQLTATYEGSLKLAGDLTGNVGAKLGALQHALVDELGKLQSEGSNLPKLARENVVKAYHDLSSLVFADKPLGDRTSDVVAYVKESLQPALDKVVEILQATKETVEDKAQEEGFDVGAVKGKAEGVKGKAEGKAKEGKQVVQGTAEKTKQKTKETASEVRQQAQQ